MASFTEQLARKSAEAVHERRKDTTTDVIDEVRKGLADLWEHMEPHAWKEATKMVKQVFEMTYECQHTYLTADQMLELLPEALQDDAKNKQITCRQNTMNVTLYHFEFAYGHKRERILAELERDDPSTGKKPRVADDDDDKVKDEAKDEPSGDAALEVKDEDVAAIKASVGERVARVAAMTQQSHLDIMHRAVEALGFPVNRTYDNDVSLEIAWQRALMSENCRENALAYERAIIEVEATA
jgi:hypothetical protein